MSTPIPTRQKILETAVSIVDTKGAAHLTIDGVAAAASLSKGGVLYHFPSKRALLEAMLSLLMETSAQRIEKLREVPSGLEHPTLGPMIQAEQEQQPKQRAMALAILAAAAEDPTLLNPAKTFIADRFREAGSNTTDPQMAHILLLAAEGLRFLDMLNLIPGEIANREEFFNRLLQLARKLPR